MHSSYLILLYFQYKRSSNDLNKNKNNNSIKSNLSFNSNSSKAETIRVYEDQKIY